MKKENGLLKKRKELKETAKGRAILKLIYWCIFFFILFSFLIIMSFFAKEMDNNITLPETKPIPEEIEKPTEPVVESILSSKTIDNIANTLNNKNYNYDYIITKGEEKYIYHGSKKESEDTGYKESPTGIIKYYIDSTGVYTETTSGKTLIDNLYEDFTLDKNIIINELRGVTFTRNTECDCINYIYEGANDIKTYELELDHNNTIVRLSIDDTLVKYDLSFSNIEGE